jgi:hypothetical protein
VNGKGDRFNHVSLFHATFADQSFLTPHNNLRMGLFDKLFGKKQQQETLDQGLQKTREGFLGKIS